MTKKKWIIIIAAVLVVIGVVAMILCLSKNNFKGIIVGVSDVELTTPAVKENGIVYADLREFADYLNAVTAISEDGNIAIVTVNEKAYTFELDKTEVSISDMQSGESTQQTIKTAPRKSNAGMDIDVVAFSELLGFSAEEREDVLYIK